MNKTLNANIIDTANAEDFIFEEIEVISEDESAVSANDSRMPRLLRGLGAVIVVASAAVFLFQRWNGGDDIHRYLFLLLFTGVLSAGGFFCGVKLKESKGARTLLGLTLGVMPVNFAVMAGLFYSRFSWEALSAGIPAHASWMAPSASAALLSLAGGIAVLGPLAYLSFLALGRSEAKVLTQAFLIGNLALCVPTRNPDFAGLIVTGLVCGLCFVEKRYLRDTTLTTFEGRLARLLLWVPPMFMAGRTLHLYSASHLFSACALGAVAVTGFIFAPTLFSNKKIQRNLQGLSMVPAIFSWLHLARVITLAFSVNEGATLLLNLLPVSAILLAASCYAVGGGSNYRRLAILIALAVTSFNLVTYPGVVSSLLCISTSVAVMIYGFAVERKLIFFAGVAGAIFGLGYHLKYALQFYSLAGWGSLAVIGVSTIIAASLLERNQGQMRRKIAEFRGRVQTWSH